MKDQLICSHFQKARDEFGIYRLPMMVEVSLCCSFHLNDARVVSFTRHTSQINELAKA